MKNKSVAIVVGAVIIIAAVVAILGNKSDSGTMGSSMDMKGAGAAQNSDSSLGAAVDLTAESQVAIDIKNYAYSKPNIKIKKGTTVTWTNQDGVKHNATSTSNAPKGGPKGQLLARGDSYSFTFDSVNMFDYLCTPHPYMKGLVTVVE